MREKVRFLSGVSGQQRVYKSIKETGCWFVFSDEDGSEFEKELSEALEGLSVSVTAEKLTKVSVYRLLQLMTHGSQTTSASAL